MNKPNSCKLASLICLTSALFLMGCGDSASNRNATVQGTVTIDGELASRGTVTFHPVDSGPVAVGQIQTDGSFSLSTGRSTTKGPNSGTLFPGTYQATVMITGPQDEAIVVGEGGPPAAGQRLVAKEFTHKETSGLQFEIKTGRNLCVLPVLGAAHDPPIEDEKSSEDRTSLIQEESEASDEEMEQAMEITGSAEGQTEATQ